MIRHLGLIVTFTGLVWSTLPQSSPACHRKHRWSSYPSNPCYTPMPCTSIDSANKVPESGGVTTTESGGISVDAEEAITAEEQKWLDELNNGKNPEEKGKLEKLWREMNHKDRKELWEEIQKTKKEGGKTGQTRMTSQAILVVSLPADAKLMVDEYVTRSRGKLRIFTTPPLSVSYTYTLKAELRAEAGVIGSTKTVKVKPGQVNFIQLDLMATTFAQK
jgi:uncharacterized protein (TIGR03000 family)